MTPRPHEASPRETTLEFLPIKSDPMLVLASASPRRQDLLRHAGISFTVQPADIDESPVAGESARECAERLAREKAFAVWRTRSEDVVLGADTIVVVDEANEIILGKPTDAEDAARMLRLLSGRVHRVITGVCLIRAARGQRSGYSASTLGIEGEVRTASETTFGTVIDLSDDEIRAYVASGEPMDKAGAYAIQGMASRWIPRIEGDYSNVVGLPVPLVYRMLSGGRSQG